MKTIFLTLRDLNETRLNADSVVLNKINTLLEMGLNIVGEEIGTQFFKNPAIVSTNYSHYLDSITGKVNLRDYAKWYGQNFLDLVVSKDLITLSGGNAGKAKLDSAQSRILSLSDMPPTTIEAVSITSKKKIKDATATQSESNELYSSKYPILSWFESVIVSDSVFRKVDSEAVRHAEPAHIIVSPRNSNSIIDEVKNMSDSELRKYK